MNKSQGRKITVAEMAPHIHNFLANENKVKKITNWLLNWIIYSLDCGKIQPLDIMPAKSDLASHIGVSQGTMQNVYRQIEDAGYLESKQRIGTIIKDRNKKTVIKLTSKRELAINLLKKYIIDNNYIEGDKLPSTRKMSEYLGIPNTTLRAAMLKLVQEDIVNKVENSFILAKEGFQVDIIEQETLVEKIAHKIKKYVEEKYKIVEKLPSNEYLTKYFKVSIKTIHDAIKLLSKEGVLYTRRGQYGTIVLGNSDDYKEDMYHYEQIEQKIKDYMLKNSQVGDKLPSIKKFSELYKISEKTVKHALNNLANDGYVMFTRGRYGGTFIVDIPQNANESYKWLAISSDYVSNMDN